MRYHACAIGCRLLDRSVSFRIPFGCCCTALILIVTLVVCYLQDPGFTSMVAVIMVPTYVLAIMKTNWIPNGYHWIPNGYHWILMDINGY